MHNDNAVRVEVLRLGSALGILRIAATQRGVLRVLFAENSDADLLRTLLKRFGNLRLQQLQAPSPWTRPAVEAIEALLQGEPAERPALDLDVTDFERVVLDAIAHIPRGQTRSYRDIAESINRPRSSRAVGQACGANPVPILIPCHRVIGSSGDLVGFGGGTPTKVKLLAAEGVLLT